MIKNLLHKIRNPFIVTLETIGYHGTWTVRCSCSHMATLQAVPGHTRIVSITRRGKAW